MSKRFTTLFFLVSVCVWAQRGGGGGGNNGNPPVASLKTVNVPQPTGLSQYVQDQNALVALGKALFWDAQVGSDGQTACATCHFHAGADHRLTNTLSGAGVVPNSVLTAADFPFHKLSNPGNNGSAVVSDKRQVAGSTGVVEKNFLGVVPGANVDLSTASNFTSQFQPNGIHTRQVTARNSPSVINAVFNVRNSWDGRASNIFTGATPFGVSDGSLNASVYRNGALEQEAVRMDNASLASQAVGPALNSVEMSWAGRDWEKLGHKMLGVQPLARQKVAGDDSVLGGMANPQGNGLAADYTYARLIRAAFRPEYWSAPDGNGTTQMERNFGLIWGLAIQAYEATLIANDSRVDQFLEGQTGALTALEIQGLNEFRGGGANCTNCHNGAEFSAAGFTNLARRNGNVGSATNAGFFRIAVSPLTEDAGLGGVDGFGLPLIATQAGAQGTFKTPQLRNVEFTGPYFHNGGQATLEQVVQFYARHGDFPTGGNLGPGFNGIRLNAGEQTAVVAFLKALSDDRVRFQKAPFDHPSLCVPNGHVETSAGQLAVDATQDGLVAQDKWALVPVVGRNGLGVPLQTFEELLAGVGNDGSRANTMTQGCTP